MDKLNPVLNWFSSFIFLFSKPQIAHIFTYVTGLIVAEKDSKNVQHISQINGNKNQSSLNRFLTASKWVSERVLTAFITSIAPKRVGGVLILDDTKIEKTSESTDGVGILKDYVKGGYGLFHVIPSTFFYGFGRHIPMFLDIYLKEDVASKMNHVFKTKIEIGIELLRKCLKFVKPKAIVFDGWYLSKGFIDSIPKNMAWVSRLKISLIVLYHGKKHAAKELFALIPKKKFRSTFVRFGRSKYRWVASMTIDVMSLGKVRLVLLKKRHNSVSGIILVTNTSWSIKEVIAIYKKRWKIEVFYRDAKQHLGFGDYQITKLAAIIKHLNLVSLTYGLLKNRKYYANQKECKGTIGELCRSMKSEYWIDKIVRESVKTYEEVKDVDEVITKMKCKIPLM